MVAELAFLVGIFWEGVTREDRFYVYSIESSPQCPEVPYFHIGLQLGNPSEFTLITSCRCQQRVGSD